MPDVEGSSMDLRGLQYFVKIAELGSITKAAGHLHVAQPALSRQVKQLEEQLGAELLIRESRGIRLTDSGRQLFDHAHTILREVERAQDEVRSSAGRPSGRVVLGVVPTICPVIAPALVSTLRRDFPHIELTITEDYTTPMLDRVGEGRVDLAVLTEPPPTRRVVIEPLLMEEMALAAPRGARKPGVISIDELSRTPIIISQGLRNIMDNLLGNEGPMLTVMLELNSIETIRLMVREGIGPAVLPRSIVRTDAAKGELTLHRIGAAGIYRRLATAHSRTRRLSFAAQTVQSTITAIFADLDRQQVFRCDDAERAVKATARDSGAPRSRRPLSRGPAHPAP
jgi:LysR family transcriptional regulator, nitrogen assimilation regulatory protein